MKETGQHTLGGRMKRYEAASKTCLIRRTPVILRVDGKAFHSLTSGMDRPMDWKFFACMSDVAFALCKEIDGAMLAYFQSDEVSILLVDYKTLNQQAWFDYEVQKLCSVGASVATAAFNHSFQFRFGHKNRGLFDCRAFNVPREDVLNYFLWRQRDATRNSILTLGQSKFSPSQLHGKNIDMVQEMLFQEHQINWNDCPVNQKRGCVIRYDKNAHHWSQDNEIPIFSQDPDYIEKLVNGPFEEDQNVKDSEA